MNNGTEKISESFESFQCCMAEFEKNWKIQKGVVRLEEALEIYVELGNERDVCFDNLIQRYGRNLEEEAKVLFDSPEVESDQYTNREFSRTIFKEFSLFA